MTLPLEDRRLLRRLHQEKAEIHRDGAAPAFPAFPYGDRRRKPTSWIDRPTLQRWLKEGYIEQMSGAFRVVKNLPTRLAANDAQSLEKKPADKKDADKKALCATGSAAQASDINEKSDMNEKRDICEQDIYQPSGSLRPTRVNMRSSALARLARQRDSRGCALLSAAQAEAGRLFARDYAYAGMGQSASPAFAQPKVDGTARADGQERAMISRLDRQRRIQEAISCLGPGLDRALIAVCCENWSLDHLERSEKWGRHAGLTILRLALDRMVKFYGTQPGAKH